MTECKNNWSKLYTTIYGGNDCSDIKSKVDEFTKE